MKKKQFTEGGFLPPLFFFDELAGGVRQPTHSHVQQAYQLRLSIAIDVRNAEYQNPFLQVDSREALRDLRAVPFFHDDDEVSLVELCLCDRRVAI